MKNELSLKAPKKTPIQIGDIVLYRGPYRLGDKEKISKFKEGKLYGLVVGFETQPSLFRNVQPRRLAKVLVGDSFHNENIIWLEKIES